MTLENGYYENNLENLDFNKSVELAWKEAWEKLKKWTLANQNIPKEFAQTWKIIVESLNEKLWEKLNSDQAKLAKLYNSKETIPDDIIIGFIQWLEQFKKQGGTIIFTGWFDQNIMDIVSGKLTSVKIEDGKVKVSFVLDNGTQRTDEVKLKDAFCPDFSFYCK